MLSRSPPMSDAELLLAAIKASGLSASRFACEVIIHDERTIRRWLAGAPIPSPARDKLRALVGQSSGARSPD